MLKRRVLLLNANYEPLTIISARKAILLLYMEKVEMIERRELWVRSIHMALPLPSVIRLREYIRLPYRRVELTRRNILKRDGYRCQYCGSKNRHMTIDHIIPRRRGGLDSWENLVCACIECNHRKGDKSLEQANLKLISRPRRPNRLFFLRNFIGQDEEPWKPYLYAS
ncbi:HNH endonuclease [candidate division KSB1 bacterium]|jgi:5-methylcytosine-specific restriction endonuclease McrA|nr:HNH endonuclease [candidate division KSB1 bacterium]